MRPVITPEESSRLDMLSEVPVDVLMDRAGLGVALAVADLGIGYGDRVLVLAGPGNNGGDGYVAARYLRQRGVDVEVRSLGYPKGEDSPARRAGCAAVAAGVRVRPIEAPEPADLIVDALFGVGFHGTLPDDVVAWARTESPVLAVDVPSGLSGLEGTTDGPVFSAVRTVTFDALKAGHLLGVGPEVCGDVVVASIGLPDPRPAFVMCDDDDAPAPVRARTAHKWSAGSVAVVGGSPGLLGAAVIASQAALQFGAGAVRLFVPAGLRTEAATGHPEIMTAGIGDSDTFRDGDVGEILAALERFDVLVLGPGIGAGSDAVVLDLLEQWNRPLVLDADGITAASLEALAMRESPTVITPHAGEFEHLTGMDAVPASAFALAEDLDCVVLLKGSPTFVGGRERWGIDSGGPELATIGTGDVLAGMIGALIARGLGPEAAARSAAHRHGLAGSALAARSTVTAAGLLGEIGRWAS